MGSMASSCLMEVHSVSARRRGGEGGGKGGEGGTPLYGLYRYVRRQRVGFFSCFGHK